MKAAAIVITALVIAGLWLALTKDFDNRRLQYFEQVQQCIDQSTNPYPESARLQCERESKDQAGR